MYENVIFIDVFVRWVYTTLEGGGELWARGLSCPCLAGRVDHIPASACHGWPWRHCRGVIVMTLADEMTSMLCIYIRRTILRAPPFRDKPKFTSEFSIYDWKWLKTIKIWRRVHFQVWKWPSLGASWCWNPVWSLETTVSGWIWMNQKRVPKHQEHNSQKNLGSGHCKLRSPLKMCRGSSILRHTHTKCRSELRSHMFVHIVGFEHRAPLNPLVPIEPISMAWGCPFSDKPPRTVPTGSCFGQQCTSS